MSIDKNKTASVTFYPSHELRREVDDWRRAQYPIPPESRAISELLRYALHKWRQRIGTANPAQSGKSNNA
jgi:hypothetical protein